MLLQFAVTNYLSFRDRTVLSALAADHVNHDPKHILTAPDGKTKVLRILALYGANASGKSNLIKAMDFACRFVVDGVSPRASIPVTPFKLSAEHREQPSTFEFDFIADNQHWSYGFSVTTARVESEWLYLVKDGEEELVFKRAASEQEDTPPNIDFGPSITQDKKLDDLVRFSSQALKENSLMVLSFNKVFRVADLILNWFESLKPFRQKDEAESHWIAKVSSDGLANFIKQALRQSGTGINEFSFAAANLDSAKSLELARLWTHFRVGQTQLSPLIAMVTAAKMVNALLHARLHHHNDVDFLFAEESDGTQRFLCLTPAVYELTQKKDHSSIFLIDELDRSLHPNLTRFILQTVLESEGTGQMIFTTHDTNLLDRTLLPEDSIWFVEKNDEGASSMYSLAEFQPEQLDKLNNSLERGYLQGRFGAIPFLGDPRRLGWMAKEQTETKTEDKPAEEKP